MTSYRAWHDYEQQERPTYRKLHLKDVRTRKPHECSVCHIEIPAGSRATSHAYLDDDLRFRFEYMHPGYGCQENPLFEEMEYLDSSGGDA